MEVSGKLYEADVAAWASGQAALLRARRFDEVDVDHVAEEIEEVGTSDRGQRRCLRSTLAGVIPTVWPRAVTLAAAQSRLARASFPEQCPWSLDEVLASDFLPD